MHFSRATLLLFALGKLAFAQAAFFSLLSGPSNIHAGHWNQVDLGEQKSWIQPGLRVPRSSFVTSPQKTCHHPTGRL